MQYFQQPQYTGYHPMSNIIKGRVVANEEEVRAAQIDFDGSVSYFPCLSNGIIYTKAIDLNGLPVVCTYKKVEPPAPKQFAEASVVNALAQRLDSIEQFLANSSNGGVVNGQHNADNLYVEK